MQIRVANRGLKRYGWGGGWGILSNKKPRVLEEPGAVLIEVML